MKGDSISIKISENEDTKGVEECKSILYGRLILKKGEKAPTAKQLHETLVPLWKINNWKISPMGKGFFEFEFSTIEEMRSIWSTGSQNLKFGILRLSQWVPDFCPGAQKQTNAQVWIRFSNLPREYWREKTLIEIACVVGMRITLDEPTRHRVFGHMQGSLLMLIYQNLFITIFQSRGKGFHFMLVLSMKNIPNFVITVTLQIITYLNVTS